MTKQELIPIDRMPVELSGLGEYVIDMKLSASGGIGLLKFYFPIKVWESFKFDDEKVIWARISQFFSKMEVETCCSKTGWWHDVGETFDILGYYLTLRK
jgi:hypothetical protein